MSAKDEAWEYVTGVARQDCVGCQMVAGGEIRRVKHTHDEHEDAAKDFAAAAVAEAKAQEWAALNGPEFDYAKLTPEQENLYCYAFNTGSKAAGDQMKAEAREPLVEALEGLQGVEWVSQSWRGNSMRGARQCPICHRWQVKPCKLYPKGISEKHMPSCPLGKALAAALAAKETP